MNILNIQKDDSPNNLICTFDAYLPNMKLTIRGLKYLEGSKGRWVAMPTKSKKVNEEWEHTIIVQFDAELNKAFQSKMRPLIEKELQCM